MTTLLKFRGQSYPALSLDNLTPGEAAAIEGVTGLTFQKIRRLADLCVCEHGQVSHRGDEDEAGDTPCKVEHCGCGEFESDMPVIVSTAMTWAAITRGDRSVRFADVSDTPYAELEVVEDDEGEGEPDPTEPPPEAA